MPRCTAVDLLMSALLGLWAGGVLHGLAIICLAIYGRSDTLVAGRLLRASACMFCAAVLCACGAVRMGILRPRRRGPLQAG